MDKSKFKLIFWISLIILLIDQGSKIYVKTHFELGESFRVFDWFKISFVENPGFAYGLSFGGIWGKLILTLFRMVVIGYIFRFILRTKITTNYFIIPMIMIFAGALGNLLDGLFYGIIFDSGTTFDQIAGRWMGYAGVSQMDFTGYSSLMKGCVVDMLYFPLFNFTWPEWMPFFKGNFTFFEPIFNIADSSIFIGLVILLIFRNKIDSKKQLK